MIIYETIQTALTYSIDAIALFGTLGLPAHYAWKRLTSSSPTPEATQPEPTSIELPQEAPQDSELLPDPWQEIDYQQQPHSAPQAQHNFTPAMPLLMPAPEPETPLTLKKGKAKTPKKKETKPLTQTELRKRCTRAKITWKDAHGKGKHLTEEEMRRKLKIA